MTKTEIRVICLQAAIEGANRLESSVITDRAQEFFDWIAKDVKFCSDCGEEGGDCGGEYEEDNNHMFN